MVAVAGLPSVASMAGRFAKAGAGLLITTTYDTGCTAFISTVERAPWLLHLDVSHDPFGVNRLGLRSHRFVTGGATDSQTGLTVAASIDRLVYLLVKAGFKGKGTEVRGYASLLGRAGPHAAVRSRVRHLLAGRAAKWALAQLDGVHQRFPRAGPSLVLDAVRLVRRVHRPPAAWIHCISDKPHPVVGPLSRRLKVAISAVHVLPYGSMPSVAHIVASRRASILVSQSQSSPTSWCGLSPTIVHLNSSTELEDAWSRLTRSLLSRS